ncbi:MAG: succinate dehydrogenase assembly factor 2 [Polaromonas sp.]
MSEFDRLRWRCRRGLLELDIVLTRFLERGYADLDAREREVFVGLLSHADNELWDLMSGRLHADNVEEEAVLDRLRAA